MFKGLVKSVTGGGKGKNLVRAVVSENDSYTSCERSHTVSHSNSFSFHLSQYHHVLTRFLITQDDDKAAADKSAYLAHQTFQHFDHSFKGELHTTQGPIFVKAFGACSFAKRSIEVLCKGTSFEIIEELGIALKKNLDLPYNRISGLSWDHANSEVWYAQQQQNLSNHHTY
jgi:hypothetical protein